MPHWRCARLLPVMLALLAGYPAAAEDGYDLWLRHAPLGDALRERLAGSVTGIVAPAEPSPTLRTARDELRAGLAELLARDVPLVDRPAAGTIVLGTPASSEFVRRQSLPLPALGDEGYVLRATEVAGDPVTLVAANRDVGVLYGVFALLRELETGGTLAGIDVVSAPRIERRVLDHWDNLDRTVERGYAGQSLWNWWRLPGHLDPRYRDYARANASLGINGTVLNNVNADALALSSRYIEKAAALADVFRPWGIRVYLSARFSAPIELGGLDTADPLDGRVRAWWRAKADEIYAAIPDFGGFLVKANSEGQPGPQDYGRRHADGANLLAEALAPHGGIVMWRAFVYSSADSGDRAKQAYDEFVPLDGEFAGNVLLQVKNGPIDFQPREPFHPLFGAMPETPLMLELQVTKEYLGFATHLVYLGTLFEEVLQADTLVQGEGSTVARVIDGSLHGYPVTGIAGVANIGSDRDWTGSPFNQANWYAFGRLAWDPGLPARRVAGEWLRMTYSRDPRFVEPALRIMLRSREAAVSYMTPLGLAHLMGTGHHYGPAPWVSQLEQPAWNPAYYHRADEDGIGFDRTATGSNAVAQYAPPLARRFGSVERVPPELLLWFHRVSWDHVMPSGRTLWEELVARYDGGVAQVERMQATWASLEAYVDAERFRKTADFLAIQLDEARWWRDACLAFFHEVSGRPFPEGVRPPAHPLAYYQSLEFPNAPGH